MRRFAFLACGLLLCTFLAVSVVTTTTATPTWSDLDHRVSASDQGYPEPECFTKCDHQGPGGVCIPTANQWTCGIHPVNGCKTVKVCVYP
jgi:hypothetical protein